MSRPHWWSLVTLWANWNWNLPSCKAIRLLRTVLGLSTNHPCFPRRSISVLELAVVLVMTVAAERSNPPEFSVYVLTKNLYWSKLPTHSLSPIKIRNLRSVIAESRLDAVIKSNYCRLPNDSRCVRNILSKLEPYAPCIVADIPAPFSKELSLSQTLNFLKLRGYIIKDDLPMVMCS